MILATRMPLRDVALLQATEIPFVWINVDIPGENVCCVCSSKIEALNIVLLHLKKLYPVKDRQIYLPPEFVIRGSCGFPMHNKNEIKLGNVEDLKHLSYL